MSKRRHDLTRRGFVRGAALTGIAAGVAGGSTVACGPGVERVAPTAALDRADLMHLAEALLPTELEGREREAVVDDLLRWLREYAPDAEMDHGYGFTRLRHTAPHPGREYADDLDGLRVAALERFGAPLAELDLDQTREVVATDVDAIVSERTDVPGRTGAEHIALAILAAYYEGPDAGDRAYGVKIRKEVCRGLFTDIDEIPAYSGYAPEDGR